MSEWQPIETAPKDGTEFAAYDKATGTKHVTWWDIYDWYDPDQHYYSEAPAFNPTHWMPLPAPPLTALEAGE